jgi:hypothetical protein
MLERLVEQIYQRLQLDAAAVLLLDQATATVQCAASYGLCADCLVQVSLDRDASFAGRAIATRRPVFVSDLGCRPATNGTGPVIHTINGHTVAITADLLSSPTIELMHSEGFVAGYIVPIISRSKPLGVLALFHRSAIASEPDWLDFLETLAGQTAIALDNAYLFEHLQQSYDATLEGWVRALDLRDKETEGHSRRVTEMTVRLAQKMGMHADDIEHVRRGALLHDIGKLGIPDNILLKPGKLTDEEWVVMRTHPVLAYEWLASIAYLRPALDIPYCHHEKWDGTGYPRGLRGEQIPLAARMFAVVDVWDALSSDRPYRKRWPADKVYAHLQDNAGTHFDPQVVEAFLALQGVPQLDKV